MKFYDALKEATENKAPITRAAWNKQEGTEDIWVEVQVPDDHSKMTKPYMYMVKRGEKFPVEISCESMFADDWKIVDPAPSEPEGPKEIKVFQMRFEPGAIIRPCKGDYSVCVEPIPEDTKVQKVIIDEEGFVVLVCMTEYMGYEGLRVTPGEKFTLDNLPMICPTIMNYDVKSYSILNNDDNVLLCVGHVKTVVNKWLKDTEFSWVPSEIREQCEPARKVHLEITESQRKGILQSLDIADD